MKHTCATHPKTLELQKLFIQRNPDCRFPELIILGMLEVLFNYLAAHCKNGAVGNVHLRELSRVLYWGMDGEISELVQDMVTVGYFEPHPEYGFVMAGWTDHCTDYVHSDLAKKGQRFWDGTLPSLRKLGVESGDRERALQMFADREGWTESEFAEVWLALKQPRPDHSLLFRPKINEPEDDLPMEWTASQAEPQKASERPASQPQEVSEPAAPAVKKSSSGSPAETNENPAGNVNAVKRTADEAEIVQRSPAAGQPPASRLTNTITNNQYQNNNRARASGSPRRVGGPSTITELMEGFLNQSGAGTVSPPVGDGNEPAAARQPSTTQPRPPDPTPQPQPLPHANTNAPAAARQPSTTQTPSQQPEPLPRSSTPPQAQHQPRPPSGSHHQTTSQADHCSESLTRNTPVESARPQPCDQQRDRFEPPMTLNIGTDEDWAYACDCADLIEQSNHPSPVHDTGGEQRARSFVALADYIHTSQNREPWPALFEIVAHLSNRTTPTPRQTTSEEEKTLNEILRQLRRFPDGAFPGNGDEPAGETKRKNFRLEQAARLMGLNKSIFKKRKF